MTYTWVAMVYPKWFLDTEYPWHQVDLEHWSRHEYTYRRDPKGPLGDELKGLLGDFLREPAAMMKYGEGDCEDYAFVAASWLVSETDDPVYIASVIDTSSLEGHVVAHTDDTVYSSGRIMDTDFDSYLDVSGYNRVLRHARVQ